jgi:hypothetical protein
MDLDSCRVGMHFSDRVYHSMRRLVDSTPVIAHLAGPLAACAASNPDRWRFFPIPATDAARAGSAETALALQADARPAKATKVVNANSFVDTLQRFGKVAGAAVCRIGELAGAVEVHAWTCTCTCGGNSCGSSDGEGDEYDGGGGGGSSGGDGDEYDGNVQAIELFSCGITATCVSAYMWCVNDYYSAGHKTCARREVLAQLYDCLEINLAALLDTLQATRCRSTVSYVLNRFDRLADALCMSFVRCTVNPAGSQPHDIDLDVVDVQFFSQHDIALCCTQHDNVRTTNACIVGAYADAHEGAMHPALVRPCMVRFADGEDFPFVLPLRGAVLRARAQWARMRRAAEPLPAPVAHRKGTHKTYKKKKRSGKRSGR